MLRISTIEIQEKILVLGVTETDAHLHKHNDSILATTGEKCTIDLGVWTILIYLAKSGK